MAAYECTTAEKSPKAATESDYRRWLDQWIHQQCPQPAIVLEHRRRFTPSLSRGGCSPPELGKDRAGSYARPPDEERGKSSRPGRVPGWPASRGPRRPPPGSCGLGLLSGSVQGHGQNKAGGRSSTRDVSPRMVAIARSHRVRPARTDLSPAGAGTAGSSSIRGTRLFRCRVGVQQGVEQCFGGRRPGRDSPVPREHSGSGPCRFAPAHQRVTIGNTMAPCVVIGERAGVVLKTAH